MSSSDTEYYEVEREHAIVAAKRVVYTWDLSRPAQLFEALSFLQDMAKETAAEYSLVGRLQLH